LKLQYCKKQERETKEEREEEKEGGGREGGILDSPILQLFQFSLPSPQGTTVHSWVTKFYMGI
jgi:hypothetical protein